jgi:ferritin-like metal-binding protein YciE
MDYESLQDLYLHELKDLHSAEKQILRALPKMIKHAASPKLKEALEQHREQTRMHVERLDQIFERIGKTTRGTKCKGIEGILEEGEDWLDEEAQPEVLDAGIISAAQRVEHYEMAAYGCARTYANLLGNKEDERLLNQTLQEEGEADKKLTSIAERVNIQAREHQHV